VTRLILKIRDSLCRLLQILEKLFELSKRKEFAFACFNFGEARGEDFLCQPGDSNLSGAAGIKIFHLFFRLRREKQLTC
jgi:hypothetical protein